MSFQSNTSVNPCTINDSVTASMSVSEQVSHNYKDMFPQIEFFFTSNLKYVFALTLHDVNVADSASFM